MIAGTISGGIRQNIDYYYMNVVKRDRIIKTENEKEKKRNNK